MLHKYKQVEEYVWLVDVLQTAFISSFMPSFFESSLFACIPFFYTPSVSAYIDDKIYL